MKFLGKHLKCSNEENKMKKEMQIKQISKAIQITVSSDADVTHSCNKQEIEFVGVHN